MSRPIPDKLAALREAVQASFGYWTKSKRVSDEARACMTAAEQKNLYYGPDRELVKRLAEAEREFTETFSPEFVIIERAKEVATDLGFRFDDTPLLSYAEEQAGVIRDTGA